MALPEQAHTGMPWLRRLVYGYPVLVVVGWIAFTLTGSLVLATGLAAAMAAHVMWGIGRTVRWIRRSHDVWRALVALVCGAFAVGGFAVFIGLAWFRGLVAAYAWPNRFHYVFSPTIALYVLFCVLIAENISSESGPGSWWMKCWVAAREHPLHLASAVAAGFALVLSGELTLEVPDAIVRPFSLIALALVAVQIALGIYGFWVYPSRHRATTGAVASFAPWMAALGWGWAAGFILALFTNYCFALVAGAVQLVS